MKNLYETLKSVINECDFLNAKDDKDVTARLKFALCFETEDSSYERWTEQFLTMGE